MDTKSILARVDENYIGRRHKHVPNLPVYAWYLNERERMRINREDFGLPRPWTKDPILAGFRFTNIHRADDRVSRDLYDEISQYPLSPLSMFNSFVFRTFNTKTGYDAIDGWTNRYNAARAIVHLDYAVGRGEKLWNSAYLMTNSMLKGSPHKHYFYVKTPFQQLWDNRDDFYQRILDNQTLESVTRLFMTLPGYAEFLGYEMALDMEMLGILSPTDKMTWANVGPGARRGLNFVFGRDRNFTQPQGEFLDELRWLMDESVFYLDPHVAEPVDMRMFENACCETSKYASVLATGRAKRRYK